MADKSAHQAETPQNIRHGGSGGPCPVSSWLAVGSTDASSRSVTDLRLPGVSATDDSTSGGPPAAAILVKSEVRMLPRKRRRNRLSLAKRSRIAKVTDRCAAGGTVHSGGAQSPLSASSSSSAEHTGLLSPWRTCVTLPAATLTCSGCGSEFDKVRQLIFHCERVHGGGPRLFRCSGCGVQYSQVHRLECHLQRCKQTAPDRDPVQFPHACGACGARFEQQRGVSQHIRHRHPELSNIFRLTEAEREAQKKRLQRLRRRGVSSPARVDRSRWNKRSRATLVELCRQAPTVGPGTIASIRDTLHAMGYLYTVEQVERQIDWLRSQCLIPPVTPRSPRPVRSAVKRRLFTSSVADGDGQPPPCKVARMVAATATSTSVAAGASQAAGATDSGDDTCEDVGMRVEDVQQLVSRLRAVQHVPGERLGTDVTGIAGANDAAVMPGWVRLGRDLASHLETIATGTEYGKSHPDQTAVNAWEAVDQVLDDYLRLVPRVSGATDRFQQRGGQLKSSATGRPRRKVVRGKVKERRAAFRLVQNRWITDRKKLTREILDDAVSGKCSVPAERVQAYFEDKLSSTGHKVDSRVFPPMHDPRSPTEADVGGGTPSQTSDYAHLMTTFSREEVLAAIRSMKTASAAGPDGVRVRGLKQQIEAGDDGTFLAGVFTAWLMARRLPGWAKESRSVLLPKPGKDLSRIENWRPLSIAPTVTRLYTKILARRLTLGLPLHPAQRGFVPGSGVTANTEILSHLIAWRRKTRGELVVAFLDVEKAFDSIPHDLLRVGLRRLGVPAAFCSVVEELYTAAHTYFELAGKKTTGYIPIRRGVKQGDPLSPVLFNVALDPLFCLLAQEGRGCRVNGEEITVMGFADDVTLVSDTRAGMDRNLLLVDRFMEDAGLRCSGSKSVAFHLVSTGKTHCSQHGPQLRVGGTSIPWLEVGEETRYLGRMIGAWNVGAQRDVCAQVRDWQRRLQKSKLRSFQRLEVWRSILVPRLKARLAHSDLSVKTLQSVDRTIRWAVREHLHLPTSTADGLIHTPTKWGGLGVTPLEDSVPREKKAALQKLMGSETQPTVQRWARAVGIGETLLKLELRGPGRARERQAAQATVPTGQGERALAKNAWLQRWARLRSQGQGVATWGPYPASNKWIRKHQFSDREKTQLLRLRTNTVPTREYQRRSKQPCPSVLCRRCYRQTETLGHITGHCPFLRDMRLVRHNKICAIVKEKVIHAGWFVETEPHFVVAGGELIPDLLCVRDGTAVVLDPTVVWESSSQALREACTRKEMKYGVLVPFVRARYDVDTVHVAGLAVGARGGWTRRNEHVLQLLGLNRPSFHEYLSNTAMGWTVRLSAAFFD